MILGEREASKTTPKRIGRKNWMMTEMSRDPFVASEGFLNTEKHRKNRPKKKKASGSWRPVKLNMEFPKIRLVQKVFDLSFLGR